MVNNRKQNDLSSELGCKIERQVEKASQRNYTISDFIYIISSNYYKILKKNDKGFTFCQSFEKCDQQQVNDKQNFR